MDFCRVSAGKMNGGNNQKDQINGNPARNNMHETVEAMEPVEAVISSYLCCLLVRNDNNGNLKLTK
jgi:hypothetical protein